MVSLPSPPERVSLPAAPLIESAWLEPTIVSLPLEPARVKLSVPELQVVKEKPEASKEPAAARLITTPWVEAVPMNEEVSSILPEPNCPAAKVAVLVPLVLRN